MTWPTKTDFVDGDVLNASQMNNIGTNLNLANPTGITDGYVLTATGTGSMGWEAPMAGSYTLITSGTITNATTTDITGLSTAYKNLEIWLYNINISASGTISITMYDGTFPGTVGGNFVFETFVGTGTTVTATGSQGAYSVCKLFESGVVGAGYTQNYFVGTFYDYASTTNASKTAFGSAASTNNAGSSQVGMISSSALRQTTAAAMTKLRIVGSNQITSASYQIWGIN